LTLPVVNQVDQILILLLKNVNRCGQVGMTGIWRTLRWFATHATLRLNLVYLAF